MTTPKSYLNFVKNAFTYQHLVIAYEKQLRRHPQLIEHPEEIPMLLEHHKEMADDCYILPDTWNRASKREQAQANKTITKWIELIKNEMSYSKC